MDSRRSSSSVGYVLQCHSTVSVPCSCHFNNRSAQLLQPAHRPSVDTINDTYDRFGPTPHLCLEYAGSPQKLKVYKEAIRGTLKQVTVQDLVNLAELVEKGQNDLDMDAFSHKIALIRREKIDDFWSTVLLAPITDYVRSKLAIHLRTLSSREQVKMFEVFYNNTLSKGLSGVLFENILHDHFRRKISIDYMPMVRLDKNDGMRKPKWYSSHSPIERGQLENLRQQASNDAKNLCVDPSDYREYDGQSLALSLEKDVYYVPMISNEVAFDSFIWHGDFLYIFQFTVSEDHAIKEGLISRFTQLGSERLPPRKNWHYIFIIPNGTKTLKCPYPERRELQELRPYSSQIVTKDFARLIPTESTRNSPQTEEDESDERPPQKKKKKQIEKPAEPRRSNRQKEKQEGKGKERQK
jgi:hypothetical protein